MIDRKIKFLENRTVEAQGEVRAEFLKGKTYSLPAASAQRWVNRGLAVMVVEKAKRPKAKTKPEPKTKPMTDYDLPKKVDRMAIDKRTEPK